MAYLRFACPSCDFEVVLSSKTWPTGVTCSGQKRPHPEAVMFEVLLPDREDKR